VYGEGERDDEGEGFRRPLIYFEDQSGTYSPRHFAGPDSEGGRKRWGGGTKGGWICGTDRWIVLVWVFSKPTDGQDPICFNGCPVSMPLGCLGGMTQMTAKVRCDVPPSFRWSVARRRCRRSWSPTRVFLKTEGNPPPGSGGGGPAWPPHACHWLNPRGDCQAKPRARPTGGGAVPPAARQEGGPARRRPRHWCLCHYPPLAPTALRHLVSCLIFHSFIVRQRGL